MWTPIHSKFEIRDCQQNQSGDQLELIVDVAGLTSADNPELWLCDSLSNDPPARFKNTQPSVTVNGAVTTIRSTFALQPGDRQRTYVAVVGVGNDGNGSNPFFVA
jgi:hypothetical protein